MEYTAIYQKQGDSYLGWVEEVPGVNTQGATLAETKENLKEALTLVLEVSKEMLERDRPPGDVIREKLAM